MDVIRFQPVSYKEPALSVITGGSLKTGGGGIFFSPCLLIVVFLNLFFYQFDQFIFMHNYIPPLNRFLF